MRVIVVTKMMSDDRTASLEDRGRLPTQLYAVTHRAYSQLVQDPESIDDDILLDYMTTLGGQLSRHYATYSRYRLPEPRAGPEISEPWDQLQPHVFEEATGWDRGES